MAVQCMQEMVLISFLIMLCDFLSTALFFLLFTCYQLIKYTTTKKKSQFIITANLAFGGRGCGIIRTANRKNDKEFDSTLGFPGEGWDVLRIATWNTRSLTFERFQYCIGLNYDILALTELWRKQARYQEKDGRFIISKPKLHNKGPHKGKPRFPSDKVVVVGILLSKRM